MSATILVADDNPPLLALLADLLEAEGHRVLTPENGAAALDLVKDGQAIDLLIADWHLPRLSGIDLACAGRRLQPNAGILPVSGPMLGVKGFALPELHGARFLAKPFTNAELLTTVQRVLESPL